MAGAVDLFAGSKSATGANLFTVDKNPLNQLFEGIDDVIGQQAGNLGVNLVTGVLSYVQKIAGAIIDAILGLPLELLSSLEPALLQSFQNVDKFFTNILGFLGGIDPLSDLFSIEAAAETFINNVLAETGLLPILDGAGHLAQAALQPLIDAIAQAFGLSTGLSFAALETALANFIATNVNAVVAKINALISGVGGTVMDDVINLINLIKQVFASIGASFPRTFPLTFGTSTSTTLADLVPMSQFQQLLDGIGGGVNHTVDSAIAALQQAQQTIHSDISQAIQDGVAGVEGAGAAITQSLQNFPGHNVQGISGDTIVADLQAVVDGGVNALNATTGLIGNGINDFETGLSNFLTTQFNNWTGGNKANAGAADVSAAALSAAEQLASLSTQAAAIKAQLPQFYGGSGAAGIGIEVPFTDGVPQGAGSAFTEISSTEYQYSGTDGYNGTADAHTDSETVSGIWSTIIPGDTWRGIYLRANTPGTTKVWARWRVVGDPGAGSSGGYYLPNDPGAYFEFQIGCDVAGISYALENFGPYALWSYAGNVVVTGYSIQFVGVWWLNYPQYLPTYGPGWVANTGYPLYLNSGNNSISLEATADTFAIRYPGAQELSTVDTTPISFMGSAYRQAGFTDAAGVPGSQVSWAFWDSGPTAGPQKDPLATLETTTSSTFADLGTVGPTVTINIGASGMALVTVSCVSYNLTAGCAAEMGFAVSGANTIAAGDDDQNTRLSPGGAAVGGSATTLLTDLDPGPTTFTSKYAAPYGGTSVFIDRDIIALPL